MMKDLPDLENIIDFIVPIEEPNFVGDYEEELVNTTLQLMYEYIEENPTAISEPDFHETMMEEIREIFLIHFQNNHFFNDNDEEDIDEVLEITSQLFYDEIIPPRSFPNTFVFKEKKNVKELSKKIKILFEKPQPQQRTPEWYEFRHNLITASNAYKAFENQSNQNQLIYEKCQPLVVCESSENQPINVNTTLHWGQKYEPLSVMIYEDMYNTKIGEFGCIQHEKYSFLGASPDGINIDKTNSRYGRLLEIKNIVNREIDGIPKKEYWIQMQLQLETFDLDECDFLETRFIEYESESDFLNDGTFSETQNDNKKGIIMYFSTNEGKPQYVYKPLDIIEKEEFDKWEQEMMQEWSHYTWIKNIFWRLEEYSCVLVLRNKKWFKDNIHQLSEIWEIIEKERTTGFAHRAPIKRAKKVIEENNCFLNVIKVRTESFDETKNNLKGL